MVAREWQNAKIKRYVGADFRRACNPQPRVLQYPYRLYTGYSTGFVFRKADRSLVARVFCLECRAVSC
jgi:hypothetical protein